LWIIFCNDNLPLVLKLGLHVSVNEVCAHCTWPCFIRLLYQNDNLRRHLIMSECLLLVTELNEVNHSVGENECVFTCWVLLHKLTLSIPFIGAYVCFRMLVAWKCNTLVKFTARPWRFVSWFFFSLVEMNSFEFYAPFVSQKINFLENIFLKTITYIDYKNEWMKNIFIVNENF